MTHHNDDARMSELYAERAAGGEHEYWFPKLRKWRKVPDGYIFEPQIKYRLKQPKPKELEVWVGNCETDGPVISQHEFVTQSGFGDTLFHVPNTEISFGDALNIPVGQQRKYKLVPVEDGE